MTRRSASIGVAVCILAFSAAIFIAADRYLGGVAIPRGYSEDMADVVRDLSTQGVVNHARYQDMHKTLLDKTREEEVCYWQDVYSLGVNGVLYPMHGQLLSLITVPFYVAIGEAAFTLVPLLLLLISWGAILYLKVLLVGGLITSLDLLVVTLGTPLILHSAHYGYDLMITAFVMAALVALLRAPWVGGILLGATLFVRPTNVFFLPLILVTLFLGKRPGKGSFVSAGLAVALVASAFFFYNYHFWGSPLVTINQRMPLMCNGEVQFYDPSLSVQTLISGWGRKLFDPNVGLIWFSSALLFLPWALSRMKATPLWPFALIILCVCLAHITTIFSFHCWHCSAFGNRFLLPVSALIAALVIVSFKRSREGSIN
jgi:hypothetical protein